jgi:peroxiredoxin family protein
MEEHAKQKYTFICSRGTLDGAYPSLILAINSVRLGHEATIFYTFMGINIVRKDYLAKVKFHPPGFLGAIPGMAAVATGMMKKQIEEANIPEVEELLEIAQLEGVRLVACRMTMDMMKLADEDLREGVEIMNAEQYLKIAGQCAINMFT